MSQSTATLDPRSERLREAPGGWPPSPAPESPPLVRSEPHSLAQAVQARKEEYIRKKTIKIKVGSWNVAAIHGTEKDLGGWFVDGKGVKGLSQDLAGLSVAAGPTDNPDEEHIESVADQERRKTKKATTLPKNDVPAVPGGDEIGLYVLGLQEVVDISSASSALRPYVDPDPGKKWKRAMEDALPNGYEKVAEQQLLGLLILVYASPEIAPSISHISATSVGTGLMGYLGNKGAVSVRVVLGEATRFVFVNCHLSAGSDKASLNRRNWDASQILSRTTFSSIDDDYDGREDQGEKIGDEDFGFWFGDLNYRLEDIPGEDVRRLLLLHTRNEYDIENKSSRKIDSELGYVEASARDSSDGSEPPVLLSQAMWDTSPDSSLDPSSDPTSLQTTLHSLLPHDQLRIQQKKGVAFHDGWQEGDINFLPTYKYDIGSVGMFDSGEKRRSPSWCDRILYRSRRSMLAAQKRAQEAAEAKKKDDDMKARGVDEAASEEGVLFDYDPDADGLAYGDDYDENETVEPDADLTRLSDEPDDSIVVSHYVSHQRVLSSDHKPLDAVFTVHYNAAIPELKAKVQQEVARSLDQAENESRPTVTLVVDTPPEDKILAANDSTESAAGCINFGRVRYRVAKVRGVTIANTGQVPAIFSFVDRPGEDGHPGGMGPSWLDVEVEKLAEDIKSQPDRGKAEYKLSPGETISVRLTVDIMDEAMVHRLNEGKLSLDEILVLRITDGRDHFLPVHGTWEQSCFCRTLDQLAGMPMSGVRSVKRQQALHGNGIASTTGEQSGSTRSVPKELSMLTDAIPGRVERTVAEWDMVHEHELPPWKWPDKGPSWPFDAQTRTLTDSSDRSEHLASAREAMDNDIAFDEVFSGDISSLVRLEVLAETLLLFLSTLRDGIVTTAMWSDMERQITSQEKSKENLQRHEQQAWIMDILTSTPVHALAFTYVTSMLNKLLRELAPVPSDSTSTAQSPRASTSSLRSAESDLSEVTTSIPSSDNGRGTRSSFLPTFRRRERSKTASSGGDTDEAVISLDRRKAIERAYTDIFAPILIRAEGEKQLKAKEKKTLEQRKRRVLEPFLGS